MEDQSLKKPRILCRSWIAAAVLISVVLGCIFAFFLPHGFFTSSSTSPILNHNHKMVSSSVESKTKFMEDQSLKKPRILCLHGFRSNAEKLKQKILVWPESVMQKLDLVFLNGPFPSHDRDRPDGFEWFQTNEDFTEYSNFDECIAYIEDYMVKNGPFDGVLGLSQGGCLTATLPGMQEQGVALTKVEKIKFVIVISGSKLGGENKPAPELASNAFSKPIEIPSLHMMGGETDVAEQGAIALLDEFVNPFVIHHHQGHTVPRLDDKSLKTMLSFIDTIQGIQSDVHGHSKI